ncbi:hypothetical protein [Agreia sp.]|uniref:hypothetical protein n=1 Tax=Agreia sp. TaxID=1872416 RepID=UPI0035BC90F6
MRAWPLAEGNPAADSQADLDGEGDSPDVPGFPWWMLVAGGVVALAAGYVWHSERPPRRAPVRRVG